MTSKTKLQELMKNKKRGGKCGDIGICDFTTSNEGLTTIKCRQCGKLISISEFVSDSREPY